MKRTLALATLLASGLAATAMIAAAQTPAAPAAPPAAPATAVTAKVGVIAFNAVVAQTNEGQRDMADVQKKFEPKQTQLKTLNDEIEKLKKDLQAQGDKLSASEAAARTKVIDDKTKQFQRSVEDARNDYQQEMGETLNTLATKVFDVLETYAKDHGYTLVLDLGNQQQAPVLLWAADNTNISQAVLDAYNTKSGVPAPPPSAPSAAAPAASKPAAPKAPSATAPKK